MASKRNNKFSFLTPVIAFAAVLSSKLKVFLLACTKGLAYVKLSWLVTKFWSLWLSLGLYIAVFGWSFAWMLIIVLLLHEGGHWIWMRAYKLDPGLPAFVPFLGAFVAMKKLPKDEAAHAWVAFAGPLIGGVTSALIYGLGVSQDNVFLMGTGNLGFILNLLQLIPAKPLDGGFIITAISKKLIIPGICALLLFAAYRQSLFLFVIGLVSAMEVLGTLTGRNQLEQRARSSSKGTVGELIAEIEEISTKDNVRQANPAQRWQIGLAYLSLVALLGQLYSVSSAQLPGSLQH
jgi:Zn-dependent protease